MNTHACFHYQFHPVGQGLFASGCLYESKEKDPRFLWVYDCGSDTFKTRLTWDTFTGDLKRFSHYRERLDLLTLSHFDEDHINGVTSLLDRFQVDMVMLPYAQLWQRLLIAFQDGQQGYAEVMDYVIDPVSFLRARGRNRIGQIVLVLPSSGYLPDTEPGIDELPDKPWSLSARVETISATDPRAIMFGSNETVLNVLPSKTTLSVMGLWEFCPYNPSRVRAPINFRTQVDQLRNDLLSAAPQARRAALDALKATYDAAFGADGDNRNRISLSLYGGPVYPTWRACKLLADHGRQLPSYPSRLPCYYRAQPDAPGMSGKCSILYTGDGFLDNDMAFIRLASYLRSERMRRLGVFQVNHHGARDNWHQGLAGKLNPEISVFSSDPGRIRPGHPHVEVWQDFLGHRPVQVNRIGHGSGGWMLI